MDNNNQPQFPSRSSHPLYDPSHGSGNPYQGGNQQSQGFDNRSSQNQMGGMIEPQMLQNMNQGPFSQVNTSSNQYDYGDQMMREDRGNQQQPIGSEQQYYGTNPQYQGQMDEGQQMGGMMGTQMPQNQQNPSSNDQKITININYNNPGNDGNGWEQHAFENKKESDPVRDPSTEYIFSMYGYGHNIIRVEGYQKFVKVENEKVFIRSEEFKPKEKDITFVDENNQVIFAIHYIGKSTYEVKARQWATKNKDSLKYLGKIQTSGGSVKVYNSFGQFKYTYSEKGRALKECLFDCTLFSCCLSLTCPFSCLGQLCCLACIGKSMLKNRYNMAVTKPKLKGLAKILGVAKYRTFDFPHDKKRAYRELHQNNKSYHSLKGGFNEEEDMDYRKQNLSEGMDHCCYKGYYFPRYDLTTRKHFPEDYSLLITAGTLVKARKNVYSHQRLSWIACLCCCLFGETLRRNSSGGGGGFGGRGGLGGDRGGDLHCFGMCDFKDDDKKCCCCHCGNSGSEVPIDDGGGCCAYCTECNCDFKCDICDCMVQPSCECEKFGICDFCKEDGGNFCECCCGGIKDLDAPNIDVDLGCLEDKCGIIQNCDCDFHFDCCCQGIDFDKCGDFFANCCDCDKIGGVFKELFSCNCGECGDQFKECCKIQECCGFIGDCCKECNLGDICKDCGDCDICCACGNCLKEVLSGIGEILK